MAHVGVLRVLEEMRIPVDMVVGTSAGSAVGALYASGMSVAEIEQRFIRLDWLSSFRDDPGRAYKPVRRGSVSAWMVCIWVPALSPARILVLSSTS